MFTSIIPQTNSRLIKNLLLKEKTKFQMNLYTIFTNEWEPFLNIT